MEIKIPLSVQEIIEKKEKNRERKKEENANVGSKGRVQ